jgi:serine protease AprX
MIRYNRPPGRVRAGLVILAALVLSVPFVTGPALAAKPQTDPLPPESPATGFQSVATAGGYYASGLTLDLPVPADVAAGDLLIAQVAYNANGSIEPPAGWNVIDVFNHPTKPIMQGLYWRAATSAEPAHYSFALASGKSDTAVGAIAAYSGIDLTNPIHAVAAEATGTSTSVVAPSVTTSEPDTTLIGFFTVRDNGSFTPPPGTTERWDASSASGVGAIGETTAAAVDEVVAAAGATGTRTATAQASDGGIGQLVALRTASDTTSSDMFVQWEDASALVGLPPGQYSGSMSWITSKITGADDFWKAGYDGSGVDVALIDSGVVPVDGLTWPGKVINGPDLSFESQADNLRHLDTFGHGTHLAGIIAGRDDADSEFSGMAPGARIVNLKVADSQGAVDVSQVIAAVDWVIQHRQDNGMNIRVINLAYGTDGTQPYQVDPLSHAVERAWEAGIVVVVAAGNDGTAAPLRNPAVDPFVIAVGAAENDSNRISGVASFSNCGSSERFVDLVAPGRSLLSLRSPGSYADQNHPEAVVADNYFLGSGTSQAAAVVTGAVALLLDERPELDPNQVKALLTNNAQYVQGAHFTCQGAGSLDLTAMKKARIPEATAANQTYQAANGTGSLEAARGSNHVYDEGVALAGEIDIMSNPWTGYCTVEGNAMTCLDTLWDGGSFNGASWSGASWSGASWSGASWSGASWSGASWSGASWSGKSWSGASWSGASWSGASWSGASWSGASWSGDTWSGFSWQ